MQELTHRALEGKTVLLLAVVLQVLVGLLQLWVVQFAPWLLLALAVLFGTWGWGARRGW